MRVARGAVEEGAWLLDSPEGARRVRARTATVGGCTTTGCWNGLCGGKAM